MSELKGLRQQCFNSMKKVEFLLSWVVKYGAQLHVNCLMELQLEFCKFQTAGLSVLKILERQDMISLWPNHFWGRHGNLWALKLKEWLIQKRDFDLEMRRI